MQPLNWKMGFLDSLIRGTNFAFFTHWAMCSSSTSTSSYNIFCGAQALALLCSQHLLFLASVRYTKWPHQPKLCASETLVVCQAQITPTFVSVCCSNLCNGILGLRLFNPTIVLRRWVDSKRIVFYVQFLHFLAGSENKAYFVNK